MHLPSHWTKERCVEVGVMYTAPSVVFFHPLAACSLRASASAATGPASAASTLSSSDNR